MRSLTLLLLLLLLTYSSSAQDVDSTVTIQLSSVANLYERPGGSIIAFIPKGSSVSAYGFSGDYFHVKYSGKQGFIKQTYVSRTPDALKLITEARALERQRNIEENKRLEAEIAEKMMELNRRGRPVTVTGIHAFAPNSADGVGYEVDLFLANLKPVKYVRTTVRPYNAVGDVRSSRIGDVIDHRLEVVGPWNKHYGLTTVSSDVAWYNAQISCVEITRLEVEYADGTKHIFIRDLPKIMGEGVTNDCSYTP